MYFKWPDLSLQVRYFYENFAKVSSHSRQYSRFREILCRDFSDDHCVVRAAIDFTAAKPSQVSFSSVALNMSESSTWRTCSI